MKNVYVSTSNTAAFLDAIDAVERRGASEACLMVVDGDPGRGKTCTAQWYALRHRAPYLRAKREWTPPWLLRELLAELRVQPERSFEQMFRQALTALGQRAEAARRAGEPFSVILDEVDHIVRSSSIMDTVRDLSDYIEVPFVLIGMGRVRSAIARYPQTASRVAQYLQFVDLTVEDVAKLVSARCECPVDADLLALLTDTAKGYSREVLEGIAAIERHGKRLGRPVTIADMAGRTLMNDRATGRPIIVREAP